MIKTTNIKTNRQTTIQTSYVSIFVGRQNLL